MNIEIYLFTKGFFSFDQYDFFYVTQQSDCAAPDLKYCTVQTSGD